MRLAAYCVASALVAPSFAFAQGTNGAIQGRVMSDAGAAIPGVAIAVDSAETGVHREAVGEGDGSFSVPGLPIGSYSVRADVSGVGQATAKPVPVNVATATVVDFRLNLSVQAEAVSITTAPTLIDLKDSGAGEVVAEIQIHQLPLNGRQYANVAALTPGVGLTYLLNVGSATQYAPQIAGGTGRNVSTVIDGGDQNDDHRGGAAQLFPLEAIDEFNFHYRYPVEHGRSSGGVLNVVTKSGTNTLKGSAFGYLRDDSLQSLTERERLAGAPKSDFRRYQYGGSLGGPLKRDRIHFFAAYERVDQTASRTVNTLGIAPEKDGVFDVPLEENILLAKLTAQPSPRSRLSLRYAYDSNYFLYSYGTAPDPSPLPPETWVDLRNHYHSLNLAFTTLIKPGLLNDVVLQFTDHRSQAQDRITAPLETFPNGVGIGRRNAGDQSTTEKKYFFREDLTIETGPHEFKLGLRYTHAPTSTTEQVAFDPLIYQHALDRRDSPFGILYKFTSLGGRVPKAIDQSAAYAQDAWRVSDRLTIDFGGRYDLATGFAVDQSANPLFRELQAAGQAGRLSGATGLEDFGSTPAEDRNNFSARGGFVWDVHGNGRSVVRGGAGRYYDFAYTDVTTDRSATSGYGYYVASTTGIRNPNGSFYKIGDPLPPSAYATPPLLNAGASTPLVKQPYTDQANLGVSWALGKNYAIEIDGVFARGRDFALFPAFNVLVNGQRRFASVLPTTGNVDWTASVSRGTSDYRAVTVAAKRQWDRRLQFLASYTLARTVSTLPRGVDEPYFYTAVNAFDPFAPVQNGPTLNDARHQLNISGIWSLGAGFQVSTIFRARSKTPYTILTGYDDNRDGVVFDLPAGSQTINQGRGAGFTQLDFRLSKQVKFAQRSALELIVEGFNVFNAKNPASFQGNQAQPNYGQPQSYAGDTLAGETRQGEQRQFRLGLHFTF